MEDKIIALIHNVVVEMNCNREISQISKCRDIFQIVSLPRYARASKLHENFLGTKILPLFLFRPIKMQSTNCMALNTQIIHSMTSRLRRGRKRGDAHDINFFKHSRDLVVQYK